MNGESLRIRCNANVNVSYIPMLQQRTYLAFLWWKIPYLVDFVCVVQVITEAEVLFAFVSDFCLFFVGV